MRKLPPVGTPLQVAEMAAALRAGPEALTQLAEALAERVPSYKVWLFGSGRAALGALLAALRTVSSRTRVIVPAYTCWSVPAAIVRTGLRVVPADVRPGDIDYDMERLSRLDWSDVLAVISPNLFGLPGDLTRLQGLAEAHDAVMIDDAAQALGASLRGAPVGSFGLAGIASFGRGKNMTALGGGAAFVRDDDLVMAMDNVADQWRNEPPPPGWNVAAKGAAMRLALHPQLFGAAAMMPGVTVGRTVYEPNFPTPALGPARAAVALRMLDRLDRLNQRRGQLAEVMDRYLGQSKAIVLPKARSGAVPSWLRRPILMQEPARRDELLTALQNGGIGATAMYPAPVHKIDDLAPDLDLRGAPFAGAERLASSLIALPLVEGWRQEDMQRLARIVTATLGRMKADRWV